MLFPTDAMQDDSYTITKQKKKGNFYHPLGSGGYRRNTLIVSLPPEPQLLIVVVVVVLLPLIPRLHRRLPLPISGNLPAELVQPLHIIIIILLFLVTDH